MFYISKLFWGVLQPGMLLLLLTVAGALLLGTRYQRVGRGLVIAAAIFFVLGGLGPLSTWMILPLEERFPRAALGDRPVDGIVILGGSEDARVAKGRGTHALNESGERMTEAATLARRYPNAKILFTGGTVEILREPTVEADAAGMVLRDLGIGSDRLLLERKARNTAENAMLAKQLADPKPGERWLLLTSAWHMPRAIGSFPQGRIRRRGVAHRLPHRRSRRRLDTLFLPGRRAAAPRLRREGMARAAGEPGDGPLGRPVPGAVGFRQRPTSRTGGPHRPPSGSGGSPRSSWGPSAGAHGPGSLR